jgi:hypothetical protein
MALITLRQLQKRTKHPLISDMEACCNVFGMGLMTCREAERATEKRYPGHRQLRLAAKKYFLNQGWEVVPHGVGVNGTMAMSDLVIAKQRRIIFVECLTPHWVSFLNAQRKRRLERYHPLWFVIEDPAIGGDRSYRDRAGRLAKRSRVFVWSKGNRLVRHSLQG